jgi:hypothetical protein
VSEVSRVVARYPLGVHASQNLLHDTPWVCTSTGIHDTLRVCKNHKLRGLAVKCTCHTPHSAHTRTVYTCTRVKAEYYDSLRAYGCQRWPWQTRTPTWTLEAPARGVGCPFLQWQTSLVISVIVGRRHCGSQHIFDWMRHWQTQITVLKTDGSCAIRAFLAEMSAALYRHTCKKREHC